MSQRQLQFADEIDTEESILESDDGLVEWVREEFGDGLRVVGAYNEAVFEILYIAENVRDQYTREEILATGDEYVLSHLRENDYQEHLYDLGRLDYVVHGFEDGQVFRIPLEHNTGLIVSFESTTDVTLPTFVEHLKNHYSLTFR